MKVSLVSIGLLAMLSPIVGAWSTEDREIFRIRDELINNEPDSPGTFYEILGVSQYASLDEINKAYKSKVKTLHPDKVKQHLKAKKKKQNPNAKPPSKAELNIAVKRADERQARLSLIVNILKGPERDRYDHFLNNGFPLWKGTDYYYDRYRPGLGTAIFGVFLVGGGAIHYLILFMSWKRQREFVERYVKFARETAWGKGFVIPVLEPTPAPVVEEEDEDGPPQPMNRKQRRLQERESKKEDARVSGKKGRKAKSASVSREPSAAPTNARKRVVAENGKILVVDSVGNVYLEEEDEEGIVNEFLLDPEELAQPTFLDTAVVQLPLWAFNTTIGRFLPKSAPKQEEEFDIEDDSDEPQHTPGSDSAGEDFELLEKSTDSLNKGKTTGAQQGGKANKRKGKKK